MKNKKTNKPDLGRDPTKGMLAFKTGAIADRKSKAKNRKGKQAQRAKNNGWSE